MMGLHLKHNVSREVYNALFLDIEQKLRAHNELRKCFQRSQHNPIKIINALFQFTSGPIILLRNVLCKFL